MQFKRRLNMGTTGKSNANSFWQRGQLRYDQYYRVFDGINLGRLPAFLRRLQGLRYGYEKFDMPIEKVATSSRAHLKAIVTIRLQT